MKTFSIQNVVLDKHLLPIGATAFAMYCVLVRLAAEGITNPTIKELGESIGVESRSASRCVKTLENAGLISITPDIAEDGGRLANHYAILEAKNG